jgi:hypothetical protein
MASDTLVLYVRGPDRRIRYYARMRWLLVLLVACGPARDDVPVTRDPNFRASHTGSLDPTFPFGNELTLSLGDDVTEPLRKSVETAMRGALGEAAKCMEGIYGTAPLEVELDASGKVTKAKITKGLIQDTPIAACIEKAFSTMQIGAVTKGAPVRISYPVRNMPSADQIRDAAEMLKKL